jgi:hypothetical protein
MYLHHKRRKSLKRTNWRNSTQAQPREKVWQPIIVDFKPGLILSTDEEMADKVAQQEEAEIEALLSMIDTEYTSGHPEPYGRSETPYGSDDEEYDHIFLNVIKEESMSNNKLQQAEDTTKTHEDMMDMS